MTQIFQPDVLIVGGGPAGLSCAIAAAMRGLSVVVSDAMQPPIDKACGEGLMPDSLAALASLGVLIGSVGAPLHGIRFLDGTSETEAAFRDGYGRGIRRISLHQLLLERAEGLGVRFAWKTVFRGLDRGVVETNRGSFRPRWIVGADGHQSRVRTAAALHQGVRSSRRVGLQQHYCIAPWTNHVEIHWSSSGQAYVTPVAEDEIGIVFLAKKKMRSLEEALSSYPVLRRRLHSAQKIGPVRGAVTTSRSLPRVTYGNVALLGDASGSVDAVTGEGLALCFRQAVALGAAFEAEDLSLYEAEHRTIQRLPHLMSRLMLSLDRSAFLRRNALGAFARKPALFRQLLEVHLGEQPVRLFGRMGMIATGLHIVAHPLIDTLDVAAFL